MAITAPTPGDPSTVDAPAAGPAPTGDTTTPPTGRPTGSEGQGLASWSELVTAALLGAQRRTPPGGSVGALLDAAAVQTLRRRAGALPQQAREGHPAAPDDQRPPLPEAAQHRLRTLLTGRPEGGRHSTAPDLTELLPQWLQAANRHGYRPPSALLPALLDAARGRTNLRPEALTFAGPRGLWLARLNPAWKFALRSPSTSAGTRADVPPGSCGQHAQPAQGPCSPACAPDSREPGASAEPVEQAWEEGLFAERVTLLTEVRRADPAAGLALLERSWREERAEDRLMFLDALREKLSSADEAFLERALSDRSRTVRATAAELLSALPESALAARMAARAHAHLRVDPPERSAEPPAAAGRRHTGPRVTVEAPRECDPAMQRDGVAPKPPTGRGERGWWLGQLVEATPLESWLAHFGCATPEEVVALPVADGWQGDFHTSLCRAAVRQRNVAWARALIGLPTDALADGPGDPAKLLTVLPSEERGAWAAEFIAAHGLSEAFRILGVCSVPWSERLGRAVIDALEIARDAGSYQWSFSGVMGLAERCLQPSCAERLAPLTAIPEEAGGGSPGAGVHWAEAFQRLVGTLRLRETMLAELSGAPSTPCAPSTSPTSSTSSTSFADSSTETGEERGASGRSGISTAHAHRGTA